MYLRDKMKKKEFTSCYHEHRKEREIVAGEQFRLPAVLGSALEWVYPPGLDIPALWRVIHCPDAPGG
jgi:hypothetical protein